jgi:hypothetical protein
MAALAPLSEPSPSIQPLAEAPGEAGLRKRSFFRFGR